MIYLASFFNPSQTSFSFPLAGGIGIACGYFALIAAAAALYQENNPQQFMTAALAAHALVLTFAPLLLGAPSWISWVGAAIMAGVTFYLYGNSFFSVSFGSARPPFEELSTAPPGLFDSDLSVATISSLLDEIPTPALLLDEGDHVFAVNDKMAETLHKDKQSLQNTLLNDVISDLDSGMVPIENRNWIPYTTRRNDRTLLILAEGNPVVMQTIRKYIDMIDPDTGLYAEEYAHQRTLEEFEAARRYRRRLSAVLLTLKIRHEDELAEEEKRRQLRRGFALATRQVIRTCDSAFLMKDGSLLLLLPDTPNLGVKRLLQRLYSAFIDTLKIAKIKNTRHIELHAGAATYYGNERHPFESMLADLRTARKNIGSTTTQ